MKNALFLTFVALISSAQVVPSDIKIAYVKNGEIFVVADGSQPRQLTHDGVPKYLPVWSRDGSKIAFNRDVDAKRALSELVVIDESGHAIKEVLVRPAAEAPPEGLRYVESMEWISNDKIAIGGTQNIGLVETVVMDLKTGKEAFNILSNAGEVAVFSPDGSHFAYKDGTPHFSPEESWRPTLNVDDKPVYPEAGMHVTFLSAPKWSNASDSLAIVAEDYLTKIVNLVVWKSSGTVSKFRLDAATHKEFDLFWSGAALYAQSGGRAWRLQDDNISEVPKESAINPIKQAELEVKRREELHSAGGGNDADFWCKSCSLTALPRKRSVNN
ncbi:MAG: hypothetical protein ABSH41_29480 [Syntrophobacteraceae bacterium]